MRTLEEGKKAGLVEKALGAHINTGEDSQILYRTDTTKVLWIPDNHETELILQTGLEGEGEWLTATQVGNQWKVVRDYWDENQGSSTQIVLQAPDRLTALNYLLHNFLQ